MSTVLYDNPGPRAKARNVVYTILFLAALVAVVWWFLAQLDSQHELDWAKWKPYLGETSPWTDFLLPGLLTTLEAAALSVVIALPVGGLLGIARLSDHKWISWPAGVVVEFFRAIPVLLLMIFIDTLMTGVIISDYRSLVAVVAGLVLYNGSVLAEVVRAGIKSLPNGQSEAGSALGLGKGQLMRSILLPQAVTAMLPAIVSQMVIIVKDTAIGGAVLTGFSDLVSQGRALNTSDFLPSSIATMTVTALIYVIINFSLSMFAAWLERRLRRRKKSTGAVLTAGEVEDQAGAIPMVDGGMEQAGRAAV